MDIKHLFDQYHAALDEFSRGNPLPVKKMFSHGDNVVLANPFGPPVRGWNKASEALDFASSRFKDGKLMSYETLATYETPDLLTIFEVEKWTAKVGGRDQLSSFDLCVTSIFQHEDDSWKLILRHADPITSFHPDGPLRNAD